jgi:DNA-binding transcriptional regulator YhcF (GntR family)
MDITRQNDSVHLDNVMVSASNPIPLFLQLSANLRKQIADGHLLPGMSLPTVQALAKHCGMSQATVMRAISELAAEGLIMTRRGARTVVAPRRAASTEVLIGTLSHAPTLREVSFFNQLLEGLREGYHDPQRRFLTTFTSADPVDGAELLKVCQVAQADGIVAFRPRDLAITALQEVARQIPSVSLFYPVPDAPVDFVKASPASAVRQLLEERIAKGKRIFHYIGALSLFREEPSGSPYECIYRAAMQTVRSAGLEWTEIDVPTGTRELDWQAIGKDIPDGAVLVAGNPRLALACEGDSPRLDMISYTEFRGTVDLAAGRMTILYLGLEMFGAAAVKLLQSRVRSGNSLPARTVRLSPEVIPATAVI